MPKLFKYCIGLSTALILISIVTFLAYRLLPESSPFSRAQQYATDHRCLDCHLRSPITPTREHPTFTIHSTDALAYFAAAKLNFNSEKRIANDCNWLAYAEKLVSDHYCFICHGLYGQGGNNNIENSLKGYIPGWFGRDFDILTDHGEPKAIRQWITEGTSDSITGEWLIGPIADYILQKQSVKMIAFNTLPDEDIDVLIKYIQFIRQYGPMDMQDFEHYEKATRSNCTSANHISQKNVSTFGSMQSQLQPH